MGQELSAATLDQLFREARSFSYWQEKGVSEAQLQAIHELMIMGPTAANCLPARIKFVQSEEAKQRLKPCLAEGNVDKCMSAPVVALIGMDMEFYELLPRTFPHTDARAWYVGKPDKIAETAFRNSSLQGAYFMLAARSLGLDCGPMSGFDAAKLEETFFPGGRVKANFICAIGYGVREKLHPRSPRLDFSEVCEIL